MDVKGEDHMSNSSDIQSSEEDETVTEMMELRRGPWTAEEDFALINYIAQHGEGRWNSLAGCAGLKRTGKSCRLRWLNYLRPDVRRGNITLEEQLLILELHSRWGNRWSKIAQHLPGRTDNEIKNYWRTRVQKHAKQLKCDVNSKQFKDTMRYLWIPRLVERIQAASTGTTTTGTATATTASSYNTNNMNNIISSQVMMPRANIMCNNFEATNVQSINNPSFTPENSNTTASSDSFGISQVSTVSDLTDCGYNHPPVTNKQDYFQANQFTESLISPSGYYNPGMDFQSMEPNNPWIGGGDVSDNLWNVEDIWFLPQQFNSNI